MSKKAKDTGSAFTWRHVSGGVVEVSNNSRDIHNYPITPDEAIQAPNSFNESTPTNEGKASVRSTTWKTVEGLTLDEYARKLAADYSVKENSEIAPEGLMNKYNITHTNGTPLDPGAEYFVLRIDANQRDQKHYNACLAALQEYANNIKQHLPALADDLNTRYIYPWSDAKLATSRRKFKLPEQQGDWKGALENLHDVIKNSIPTPKATE